MTTKLSQSERLSLHNYFGLEDRHNNMLSDARIQLQGTGDPDLNAIVNDLMQLSRELGKSLPERQTVNMLMTRLIKKTGRVEQPEHARVLRDLNRRLSAVIEQTA